MSDTATKPCRTVRDGALLQIGIALCERGIVRWNVRVEFISVAHGHAVSYASALRQANRAAEQLLQTEGSSSDLG